MSTPAWLAVSSAERLDADVTDHFTIPAGLVRDANQLGTTLHQLWRSCEGADDPEMIRQAAVLREQLETFDDLVTSFVAVGGSMSGAPLCTPGVVRSEDSAGALAQLLTRWSTKFVQLSEAEKTDAISGWT